MKQLLAWTIRTTLRPALSPKTPLKLQRFVAMQPVQLCLGHVAIKQKANHCASTDSPYSAQNDSIRTRHFVFTWRRLCGG